MFPIIRYTKPITGMEFIKSEVEKNSNKFIGQIISTQVSSSHEFTVSNQLKNVLPSYKTISQIHFNCIDSSLSQISDQSSIKKFKDEEIAETLLSEASFTIATDKKPIVATYGCGSSIALGGYDPTNKIAFVVNFSNAGEVRKSGGLIFYNIAKLLKEKLAAPIQLHLRGGTKGHSEPIFEAIKIWMRQRKDLPMEIASQDILNDGISTEGKSLLIDSKTGFISEYDPKSNSKSREIGELEVLNVLLSAFEPKIKLAYSPITSIDYR